MGIIGGAWGLLLTLFLTGVLVIFSALGNGGLSSSTEVLLLTTLLGSLTALTGAIVTRVSERGGGVTLIGGASLALLGWSFQEPSRTAPPSLASTMSTSVLFFGWIALVLVGGLLAILGGFVRTHQNRKNEH